MSRWGKEPLRYQTSQIDWETRHSVKHCVCTGQRLHGLNCTDLKHAPLSENVQNYTKLSSVAITAWGRPVNRCIFCFDLSHERSVVGGSSLACPDLPNVFNLVAKEVCAKDVR